jgi:hypothetical protein
MDFPFPSLIAGIQIQGRTVVTVRRRYVSAKGAAEFLPGFLAIFARFPRFGHCWH